MKKWNLWLFASLFTAVFTLAACGDDDDEDVTPPPGNGASVSDLEGTWKSPITESTYVFKGNKLAVDKLAVEEYGNKYEGTFTLKDGEITFTYTEDGVQETMKGKVSMLYGKQVLVIKAKPEGGEIPTDEGAEVLFKNGVAPNTPVSDIQGKWFWYMYGQKEMVRGAMIIKDNNFEMIIGVWGQKYTGSFTYQGGVMKLNITNGFTSREPGTGYGDGYGNLNPATLEGQWSELDKEYWTIENSMQAVFIAATTEAYGTMVGMPVIYHKQ